MVQIPRRGQLVNGAGLPQGYGILVEDTELLAGESFAIPGVGASWNKIAPVLRILGRQDLFTRRPGGGRGLWLAPNGYASFMPMSFILLSLCLTTCHAIPAVTC